MPNTVVHLWLAEQICRQMPEFKHPDFFLGSILPDAVLSRKGDIEPVKRITHLSEHRENWEKDALTAFRKLKTPSMLEIGCFTHILTDIKARTYMRAYFNAYGIQSEQREELHRLIVPLVIRKLFNSEQDYFDCVSFAEKSEVTDYPYGITQDDTKNNFTYAYCIFELEKVKVDESELPFAMPDYRVWGTEWINSLREDLYRL